MEAQEAARGSDTQSEIKYLAKAFRMAVHEIQILPADGSQFMPNEGWLGQTGVKSVEWRLCLRSGNEKL